MIVKVEIYTQYADGEIELEEEYEDEVKTEAEAKKTIDDYIRNTAWYGSYVIGYIDGRVVKRKSVED